MKVLVEVIDIVRALLAGCVLVVGGIVAHVWRRARR